MRRIIVLLALCACGGTETPLLSAPAPTASGVDAGVLPAAPPEISSDAGTPAPPAPPTLAGCPMFPLDNAWNTDVSAEPVDSRSADYLAFMGAGSLYLHPDFGGQYGQPFAVVGGAQPRVEMSFLYASQSEPGPYPFPPDVPIQVDVDRHATVLDRDACKLYETYATW